MTEIEKLRKELNDRLDSFENKPKYEVGNWYWTKSDSLYFIEKINGNRCYGYGVDYDNEWITGYVCDLEYIKRLATEFEVDEMLKKEAIKLYKYFNKVKPLWETPYDSWVFDKGRTELGTDNFYYKGICVMQNGIWATPIKEKTIEEWGEEFLEFYKKSKNQSLAEAFCEFITKHNFKLPT